MVESTEICVSHFVFHKKTTLYHDQDQLDIDDDDDDDDISFTGHISTEHR